MSKKLSGISATVMEVGQADNGTHQLVLLVSKEHARAMAAHLFEQVTLSIEGPYVPRCDGCGQEVDPMICQCGEDMDKHGAEEHEPLNQGCLCAAPVAEIDYDPLDPGIRDTVRKLRQAGFETTDSGDGVSKQEIIAAGYALDFPHVFCRSNPAVLLDEAHRMRALLGDSWIVEANYSPADEMAILMCRKEEGDADA